MLINIDFTKINWRVWSHYILFLRNKNLIIEFKDISYSYNQAFAFGCDNKYVGVLNILDGEKIINDY